MDVPIYFSKACKFCTRRLACHLCGVRRFMLRDLFSKNMRGKYFLFHRFRKLVGSAKVMIHQPARREGAKGRSVFSIYMYQSFPESHKPETKQSCPPPVPVIPLADSPSKKHVPQVKFQDVISPPHSSLPIPQKQGRSKDDGNSPFRSVLLALCMSHFSLQYSERHAPLHALFPFPRHVLSCFRKDLYFTVSLILPRSIAD